MLEINITQLSGFVDGREIPEETAEALYPHCLRIKGQRKAGSNREETTECEDLR